ncbi:astakine-like [Scylla paramamosain]|uniref:astakine-like n=1 Tax=Scylla paramamosain TaxID=85552 RepID=UPI003083CDB4
MGERRVLLLAVAVAVAVAGMTTSTAAELAGCTHNDQCEPLSCCRIRRIRFPTSRCSPLGTVGSLCFPFNTETTSYRILYPNRAYRDVEKGHLDMCPCQAGLVCHKNECRPEDEVTTHGREQDNLSLEFY